MPQSQSTPPASPHDSAAAVIEARFNALVLPHLDRMLGFATRRTESTGDAEDAVQEACIRAWKALADLRDENTARAWLYRILRSVLADAHGKNTRRRALVSITRIDDAHEELMTRDDDGVFSDVVARINGEQLRSAFELIPPEFATAVELHDIDGFKYHEIAEIVGVPLGTVMSRISRGRRLLAATIHSNRKAWALGAPTAFRAAKGRSL